MSSKWWKYHVDPTEESLLKYRLKMLGMALKKLYRITLITSPSNIVIIDKAN